MSGKRFLDAVAVFNASRAVAFQHLSIRRSQVELYARTSSLTKRWSRRTGQPRIDLSASGQAFSQRATAAATSQSTKNVTTPSAASVEGRGEVVTDNQGTEQDHHYERSQENSTADSVRSENLEIRQAKAKMHPLADGTIPPEHSEVGHVAPDQDTFSQRTTGESKAPLSKGSPAREDTLQPESSGKPTRIDPSAEAHDLSADDAKVLQRQSESQIPSHPAEPPTGEAFSTCEAACEDQTGFAVEQEQDVFYQPPNSTSPVLSALPRLKVPKTTEDTQGGDPHVPQKINADVFYSSKKLSEKDLADQSGTTAQEPSDEALGSLFSSPRAARLLGLKSKHMPGGLKPPGSRSISTSRLRSAPTNGADVPSARERSSATNGSSETDEQSLKQLAADMAKDAQSQQSVSSPWFPQMTINADQLTDQR